MPTPDADELPPVASAEGYGEFMAGRTGGGYATEAQRASAYARTVQFGERVYFSARDVSQEGAVTLCERGKIENAARIRDHNERAERLNEAAR